MKIEAKKLAIIDWLIHVDEESTLDQIDFLRKSDEDKWALLEKEEREAIKKRTWGIG